MTQRPRLAHSLSVAALLLAAAPLAAQAPAAGQGQVARLARYTEAVTVVREALPVTLRPDLPLLDHDTILTREGGRAVVIFNDNSELRVLPRSKVQVSDRPGTRDVEVFFGRLWAFVVSRREKQTNFKSGGTIAAVRGTILEYSTDPFAIGVNDGSVEYIRVLGDGSTQTFLIEEGMALTIVNGELQVVPFEEGSIADPREVGDPKDEEEKEKQKRDTLLVRCSGCQVPDPLLGRCVDNDALCPDQPCFRERRCVAGACTGGRRIISQEDPNCP